MASENVNTLDLTTPVQREGIEHSAALARAESSPPPSSRRVGSALQSLVRNSAFLVSNTVLASVSGFAALTLLAHLYPARALGLSGAALAATSLVITVSQLGLDFSLPRFLPVTKNRSALINSALTATLLVAAVSAGVFLLLPPAHRLYALGAVLFIVTFWLTTVCAAGFDQLETVFVAETSAHLITRANIFTNAAKLVLPCALLPLGIAGAYVSQSAAFVVGFVSLLIVLGRRGHWFHPSISSSATRELRRFSVGTYLGSTLGSLPLVLLPLIILARFGPVQNAYWYTAMLLARLLYLLPGCVSQALLAEGAHRPTARRELLRRAATLIGAIMVPLAAFAFLTAPIGLAILGPRYAAGSLTPLRWLIVAGLMSGVNYLAGTVLSLAKKTFVIAVINAIDVIIILGLVVAWAHNVDDVAVCWVIGEIANVILFTLAAAWSLVQVHGKWEALGGQ
jgi:O-antigen/teichoic acid export membrane protein